MTMTERVEENSVSSMALYYAVITNECDLCASLQKCYSDGGAARCVDWHACQQRQKENRSEPSIRLTDSDVAMLLERMETQQADMERLKRIEAAAVSFVQAIDAFNAAQGDVCAPVNALCDAIGAAEDTLRAVVKGGKK
jgi:hypothetical protein